MNPAAGQGGAAVRIESCGKTFADGTRALEPATLDIARGETLVLLGPSGCGKTTMLRIIAGLELPDTGGRVLFDGRDMTAVPIERRNVGMVFQSYALFPNMSVADNIGYGLKIRGMASEERAARVADFTGFFLMGKLIEFDNTAKIFKNPSMKETEDYVTGRFG